MTIYTKWMVAVCIIVSFIITLCVVPFHRNTPGLINTSNHNVETVHHGHYVCPSKQIHKNDSVVKITPADKPIKKHAKRPANTGKIADEKSRKINITAECREVRTMKYQQYSNINGRISNDNGEQHFARCFCFAGTQNTHPQWINTDTTEYSGDTTGEALNKCNAQCDGVCKKSVKIVK